MKSLSTRQNEEFVKNVFALDGKIVFIKDLVSIMIVSLASKL